MGADLTYIESTAELTFLQGNGFISSSNYNKLNAHRIRYGPLGLPNSATTAMTWSNGVPVYNNYGIVWNSGEPNEQCSTESCFELYASGYANDVTCYVGATGSGYHNGIGSCKRPMCGVPSYAHVYTCIHISSET